MMLFSRLPFIRLRVGFVSPKRVEFPEMLGSTIRGAFGNAFKQAACVMDHEICSNCWLTPSCPYFLLYESLHNGIKSQGIQTPPHPYIIFPPTKNIYLQNEVLYFQFTCFGDRFHLPYLIYAFQLMGKRGLGKNRIPFELISIQDEYTRKEVLTSSVPNLHNLIVRDVGDMSNQEYIPDSKYFISFITPLRFLKKGKILKNIDLPTLKENIARRYRILMQLYGHFHPDDLGDLDLLEMEVIDSRYKRWQRFSSRQKSKINQDGVYAKWVLSPNSPKNQALLNAYRILHLGKSATFGLGKFRSRKLY